MAGQPAVLISCKAFYTISKQAYQKMVIVQVSMHGNSLSLTNSVNVEITVVTAIIIAVLKVFIMCSVTALFRIAVYIVRFASDSTGTS